MTHRYSERTLSARAKQKGIALRRFPSDRERTKRHAIDQELLYLADPVARINETFRHGYRLDPTQELIVQSQALRMIVNCTRQWGKTSTVADKVSTEALAWPGLILVIAPVERQARELFRKIRSNLKRALPNQPWPEDNKTSLELPNGARVVALPAKGENIRGYTNPRLIVIDEAAFVPDDDYRSIRPMLSHGARLILMSTPFGKQGFFHAAWNAEGKEDAIVDPEAKKANSWERYQVKATDCPHIPSWFLEEERVALGPIWYEQEYECRFVDAVTSFFDMEAVRESLQDDIDPLFRVGTGDVLSTDIKPLFLGGV